MTDTKELRRLAQAATPGPWQFWHGWVATNIDSDGGTVIAERPTPSGGKYQARVDGNFRFIAAANPATISELLNRIEAAESDAVEQARLNGMGASREAALMAKLEAAEKDRDALRAKIEAMEKQEPVAWVDAKEEGYEFYGISYLPVGKHHLYAAPVSAEAIRAEALKEAEEIAKTIGGSFADEFLAATRELK